MRDPSTTLLSTGGPFHKLGQLADMLGMSPSTVKRREKQDPDFPKGIQLAPRIRVYSAVDVQAYLQAKQAETAR